jgi:hypothetical protein
MAIEARAELLASDGQLFEAIPELQGARDLWIGIRHEFHAARLHLRMADLVEQTGEGESARLERGAARLSAERSGSERTASLRALRLIRRHDPLRRRALPSRGGDCPRLRQGRPGGVMSLGAYVWRLPTARRSLLIIVVLVAVTMLMLVWLLPVIAPAHPRAMSTILVDRF